VGLVTQLEKRKPPTTMASTAKMATVFWPGENDPKVFPNRRNASVALFTIRPASS
jgi:hypothetical protein